MSFVTSHNTPSVSSIPVPLLTWSSVEGVCSTQGWLLPRSTFVAERVGEQVRSLIMSPSEGGGILRGFFRVGGGSNGWGNGGGKPPKPKPKPEPEPEPEEVFPDPSAVEIGLFEKTYTDVITKSHVVDYLGLKKFADVTDPKTYPKRWPEKVKYWSYYGPDGMLEAMSDDYARLIGYTLAELQDYQQKHSTPWQPYDAEKDPLIELLYGRDRVERARVIKFVQEMRNKGGGSYTAVFRPFTKTWERLYLRFEVRAIRDGERKYGGNFRYVSKVEAKDRGDVIVRRAGQLITQGKPAHAMFLVHPDPIIIADMSLPEGERQILDANHAFFEVTGLVRDPTRKLLGREVYKQLSDMATKTEDGGIVKIGYNQYHLTRFFIDERIVSFFVVFEGGMSWFNNHTFGLEHPQAVGAIEIAYNSITITLPTHDCTIGVWKEEKKDASWAPMKDMEWKPVFVMQGLPELIKILDTHIYLSWEGIKEIRSVGKMLAVLAANLFRSPDALSALPKFCRELQTEIGKLGALSIKDANGLNMPILLRAHAYMVPEHPSTSSIVLTFDLRTKKWETIDPHNFARTPLSSYNHHICLMRLLPTPIVIYDKNGVCIYWSQKLQEITGYPASRMCGRTDAEIREILYRGEHLKKVNLFLRTAYFNRQWYRDQEFIATHADGTTELMLAWSMLPTGESGSIRIARHITDSVEIRRRSQERDAIIPFVFSKESFFRGFHPEETSEKPMLPSFLVNFAFFDNTTNDNHDAINGIPARRVNLLKFIEYLSRRHAVNIYRSEARKLSGNMFTIPLYSAVEIDSTIQNMHGWGARSVAGGDMYAIAVHYRLPTNFFSLYRPEERDGYLSEVCLESDRVAFLLDRINTPFVQRLFGLSDKQEYGISRAEVRGERGAKQLLLKLKYHPKSQNHDPWIHENYRDVSIALTVIMNLQIP